MKPSAQGATSGWVIQVLYSGGFLFVSSHYFILPRVHCHRVVSSVYLEVIDISPSNLDSTLCFFQRSVSHDVLCIEVKQAGWQYTALMYSFSYLEPVCCSMSSSNCCFLTCIQVSQEAGQVVWYSHLSEFSSLLCSTQLKALS